MRALRARARAGEPRRADAGPRRRAVARAPLAHRRRARRPLRVAARPVRGRARRRRGLGSRRARHEGRGRGVAPSRWRPSRARAGAAPATSSSSRPPTRRSATASGSQWLVRGASRRGARRLPRQRGRRRPRRDRRRRALPVRDRREDELAVPSCASTAAAGTRRCRRSPTTRSSRRRALIERLGAFAAEPRLIPEVEGFLPRCSATCRLRPTALAAARRSRRSPPSWSSRCSALTVAPTMAHASEKRNVIPALCEITVDIRLLPGQTPRRPRPTICARSSATGDYELVNIEARGGTRSRDRRPALGCRRGVRRRGGARRASRRRSAAPASPTRTGCARRSARSPTASSRRGDGPGARRRG